jgi:hypothetical protein
MFSSSFFRQHVRLPLAALLASCFIFPAQAQDALTQDNLLDRIMIEDFLVKYYYDLASGNAHELSNYFTDDALLDVDGVVAVGHDEINALYGGPAPQAESDEPEPVLRAGDPYRRGHMLLTNPVIELFGDRAEAHVVWTGIMNDGVGERPQLYEQGREDTELRKVNGKWLISKRYISSDSGLPDRFDDTLIYRDNPLAD